MFEEDCLYEDNEEHDGLDLVARIRDKAMSKLRVGGGFVIGPFYERIIAALQENSCESLRELALQMMVFEDESEINLEELAKFTKLESLTLSGILSGDMGLLLRSCTGLRKLKLIAWEDDISSEHQEELLKLPIESLSRRNISNPLLIGKLSEIETDYTGNPHNWQTLLDYSKAEKVIVTVDKETLNSGSTFRNPPKELYITVNKISEDSSSDIARLIGSGKVTTLEVNRPISNLSHLPTILAHPSFATVDNLMITNLCIDESEFKLCSNTGKIQQFDAIFSQEQFNRVISQNNPELQCLTHTGQEALSVDAEVLASNCYLECIDGVTDDLEEFCRRNCIARKNRARLIYQRVYNPAAVWRA